MAAKMDNAIGRYVYLEVDGIEYRVYFEEAGTGIPLLCQHTAGADARQFRHLLEDPEITESYRVIAYDLPFHGHSLPPTSVRWWEQEYKLTKEFFTKFILAFSRTLELDNPAYIGSSMGGDMAIDLALDFPDEFRALIGLEAALHTPGYCIDYWFHPEISNQSKPAAMYALTAPTSPEAARRETAWVYSQGAPPVFKGDLYYFSVEHDLRERAGEIDTSRVPLYIMNGEYDSVTSFDAAAEVVSAIKGAKRIDMIGVGHFPMSENPTQFMSFLKPVLWEIRDSNHAKALPRPTADSRNA